MQQLGKNIKNWKLIIISLILLVLDGCAKSKVDQNNDLGSGDKSNLPISLDLLIEHAEYCETIYDSGGDQKDEVAFEVKQDNGITIIVIRGTANAELTVAIMEEKKLSTGAADKVESIRSKKIERAKKTIENTKEKLR